MSEIVLATLVLKLGTLRDPKIQSSVEKAKKIVEELRGTFRRVEAKKEHDLDVEIWANKVRCASYDLEDVIDEFYAQLVFQRKSFKNKIARIHILHALNQFQTSVEIIAGSSPNAWDSFHGPSPRQNVPLFLMKGLVHQTTDESVGIEIHKNNLIKDLIAGGKALRVVPVVGIGGLGKTTLVKKVYQDAHVRKHFHTCSWVHVPREFKEKEILNNLIQQLNGQIEHQQSQRDLNIFSLMEKVHGLLNTTRYVVVLDGLWTISAWYTIKLAFPDNNLGSRVIITTRSTDVAYNSCESVDHIYQLPTLTEAESRILFNKKAFANGSCPVLYNEVSESILNICSGIPIAILASGGMLRSKTTLEEWVAARRRLGSDKENINDDITTKSSYRVLLLGYNDLPYHLKACYLYLSIFPEDHQIECARLIRLWVAEGLVEVMKDITPEDVANIYISELLNRSLLQVEDTTSDGRVRTCRIPPLLRTIIVMKSREYNFVRIGEEHDDSWTKEVRRLTVSYNLPSISKSQLQHIRSLLTFNMEEPLTFLFKNLRLLTVLDLQGADIVDFPSTIIDLYNLRYLSLRETKVASVPYSIRRLKKLETLDLKHTKVGELPKGILKLQRLRNLLLYSNKTEKYSAFNIKKGFKAPKRIGRMLSLQKLCFIEAGTESGPETIVSELGKLTQLRRLGILNLRREQNDELYSLKNLGVLRALSITSCKSEKMNFGRFCPPESLQRLYLIGQLESLPRSLSNNKNLVKIFLKGSLLSENPLEMLEKLPNLVHIELLQAYGGNRLLFEAGSFAKLRILGINKLESLRTMIVIISSMPNLEKLVLQDCSLLETIPSGIEHLRNLKVFHLIDMPKTLVDAIEPPPNEGTSYSEVHHIPEINANFKKQRAVGKQT